MVTFCRAALRKGKSWPESHDRAIQEVAESWEHPDWLAVLKNLKYIWDHLEGPSERYSRPYKLQQVARHNQSKAGAELIMDISNVRRHLPEGFSRCSPTAYSPSIIIELAKLLYIQPAPADPVDSSRVATNLRQILRYLDKIVVVNFFDFLRKGRLERLPNFLELKHTLARLVSQPLPSFLKHEVERRLYGGCLMTVQSL